MTLNQTYKWSDGPVTVLVGDVRMRLLELASESVQCIVTSPPYWGLRDYGNDDQIGLESTPEQYVAELVWVLDEAWRVLRKDGTLWLNLGDSYVAAPKGPNGDDKSTLSASGVRVQRATHRSAPQIVTPTTKQATNMASDFEAPHRSGSIPGLKRKDLVGIPWRVALALQAAGWWLRADIIWSKTTCMPESVQDRPTRSHEYLFLLAKAEHYYYDLEAIAEPLAAKTYTTFGTVRRDLGGGDLVKSHNFSRDVAVRKPRTAGKHSKADPQSAAHRMVESVANARAGGAEHDNPFGYTRNRRSVWEISPVAYPEAHFATFPEALVEPCIKAGSREGDTVLDPFAGSGTTLAVARRLGRKAIGIELQPDYLPLIQKRVRESALPLMEAISDAV